MRERRRGAARPDPFARQRLKDQNIGAIIGFDNTKVAIARLMAALPSVVAVPLSKKPPPPPVPYPKRPSARRL
jgi:hypothetical protein